jgi:hypothetical protein
MTQLLNFAIGGGLIATPFAFIYLYAKYKHYKELSVFNENQAEKYIGLYEEEHQKRIKYLNKFLSLGTCPFHTKPYLVTYTIQENGKFKGVLKPKTIYASGDTYDEMVENIKSLFHKYCGSVVNTENKQFTCIDVTNMSNNMVKSVANKMNKQIL